MPGIQATAGLPSPFFTGKGPGVGLSEEPMNAFGNGCGGGDTRPNSSP